MEINNNENTMNHNEMKKEKKLLKKKRKKEKRKKRMKFFLRIITFPFYLIYMILKLIIKIIKNIGKFIVEHIKATVIFLICLIIIGTISYYVYNFFKNYNKILLTTKQLQISSENTYILDEHIKQLSGKISTLSLIDNTQIKIYSGNLELNDIQIKNKKKWKIDISSLVKGINTVEIIVTLKKGEKISHTIYIYNTNDDNLGELDINDEDGDKLLNYQEDIVGTDRYNKDTDNDGISDYDEVYYSLTDPTKKDTDDNNIDDGNEDFDNDGLNNIYEIYYGTNINKNDSDEDGVSDYDEISIYKTNPNSSDSDKDGIIDSTEINSGINPNEINNNINILMSSVDKNASVILQEVSGEQLSSLRITKLQDSLINEQCEAFISGPYDFLIDGNITNAKISFKFDSSKLNKNSNPTIYYLDEKNQRLEELSTTIEENTAYATVNHFSKYVLLDKTVIDLKLNNLPNIDGSNVPVSSISNIEYIVVSFPILNIFGAPVYIYKITDKEEDLSTMETTFENSLNNLFDFVCSSISKMEAKCLEFVFSWIENDYAETFEDAEAKEDYKNILQYFFLYKHLYSTEDLEKYIIGENNSKIKDSSNSELKIDYNLDSNNDGISDYFTKLICSGQLTTKLGTNPFQEVTYAEIQKNKDYDGDKIKNGEEIEIKEENGKYYIMEHSSPVLLDSDNDGISDKNDASPLNKFDERFICVDNLKYIPATPIEDELEIESRKIYNSEQIKEYESILTRAYMMVNMFGDMPAALALNHFLDNSGTEYNFNNDWGLLETYRGKENLAKNTNSLMSVVESTVKDKQSLCFATNTELTGTNYSEHLDDLADIGWWYAVGYTRATMVCEATNIDNENYKMVLYYNIVDYYDWNKDANFITGFGGLVNDAEMYKLHTMGMAQQYRINIQYKMEIRWKKGDRYFLNNIYLYTIPDTMIVKRLN